MAVFVPERMTDVARTCAGFGLAGLIAGVVSRGGTFLGLAVFGVLCGLVLGLLARNRRVALAGAVLGAVAFMAGGALSFVVGMTLGVTLGSPDWYDALVPALMGASVGIIGGIGLVVANRSGRYSWRSVVGLAIGFALAALVSQTWLLGTLRGQVVQSAVSMGLWGVLGAVGFSLSRKLQP